VAEKNPFELKLHVDIWQRLTLYVMERTGVDRATAEKVMRAESDFWQERPDLVWAVLRDQDDAE